ncbi:MAG: SGNH/GDSL hydrolase family protein [Mycoplasmatales bacterium]|nr:SGNH/GDSL hydrolase family protein [Mycoplasmatales bacterium]
MKKIAIGAIAGGSVLVSLGIGAGVATSIILPKTNDLKDSLNNFILESGSDPTNTWNESKKINYIAFGDSETAGMNGIDDIERASYSDFLAKNLRKTNNLGKYRNYALSGSRLGDMHKLILGSLDVQKNMENADLITFTIGANDLLAFTEFFKLPFRQSLSDIFNLGPDTSSKMFRSNTDMLEKLHKDLWGADSDKKQLSNVIFTDEDKNNALIEAVNNMSDLYRTDHIEKFISINEKVVDDIFDLVTREMVTLIHDIHHLAPNAKILVLAHAFPFAQWPDEVLNKKRDDMQNRSLKEVYADFISSIDDATKASIGKDAYYAQYYSVDNLPILKTSRSKSGEGDDLAANSIYSDYIKKEKPNAKDHFKYNTMPNPADIHPSGFGYELIGNSLYSEISNKIGISKEESIKNYTFVSDGGVYAEAPNPSSSSISGMQQLLDMMDSKSTTYSFLSKYFKNDISHHAIKVLHEAVVKKDYSKVLEELNATGQLSKTNEKLNKDLRTYTAILSSSDIFKPITDIVKLVQSFGEEVYSLSSGEITSDVFETNMQKILTELGKNPDDLASSLGVSLGLQIKTLVSSSS